MQTLAIMAAYASGFALTGYHGPATDLLVTSLAIDASLAPLIAVIANRRGRGTLVWAVIGFGFGMWALALVLLIPKAAPQTAPDTLPPSSDAA